MLEFGSTSVTDVCVNQLWKCFMPLELNGLAHYNDPNDTLRPVSTNAHIIRHDHET